MPPPSPKPPSGRPRQRRRKRRRNAVSKMVAQRRQDVVELLSSIKTYKKRVGAKLRERLAPGLHAGETLPDHELSLELIGRAVERAFARLEELDEQYAERRSELTSARREVSRLAGKELYPQAVAMRRAFDGAFGRQFGRSFHTITGRTPRVPDRLTRHVGRALERLRDRDRPLPRTYLPGEMLDRAGWIRRLDRPYRRLVDAEKLRSRLQSEVDSLKVVRQMAMDEFDSHYTEALAHVEASFRMAGLTGPPVKNLRPYYRRRLLSKWARKKRQDRAAGKAEPPEAPRVVEPAEASSDEAAESAGGGVAEGAVAVGAVANISRWLKGKARLV